MRKSRFGPAIAAVCAVALLAAAPAAAAQEQAAQAGPAAEIQSIVDRMRTELMAPGDIVPGWDKGGADPDSELRAKGADKFYFVSEEGGSRDVLILTDRRISDFAPEGWQAIDSYGSPVDYAENPVLEFAALDGDHAVGLRAGTYRENGIDCTKTPVHAILYRRSGAAQEPGEDEIPPGFLFRILMLGLEGQVICSRSDPLPGGGWRIRALRPDGRDLKMLNEKPRTLTIVPAAPIDQLVRAEPEG